MWTSSFRKRTRHIQVKSIHGPLLKKLTRNPKDILHQHHLKGNQQPSKDHHRKSQLRCHVPSLEIALIQVIADTYP